ncbi:MAG: translation initiation factor IF-2 [Patescibacteria group bacterium]|nr:translation initiation factor IF-2 [Patescibacteria group bacterium]
MNVSELARKLKINSAELLEILPEFGFDIGKRAIKVDERLAHKILNLGPKIKDKIEENKIAKSSEPIVEKEVVSAPKEILMPSVVTVKEFAGLIGKPVNEVIKQLMKNGVMASLNERIDFDTASITADEFGIKAVLSKDQEAILEAETLDERMKKIFETEDKKKFEERPPVVVVMGHVDHGKTKLLDAIRKTNVIATESGGITQHIGAYQVVKQNKLITFIDTPGHEAFTAMRSRGARVADVAILVVAANDSIKPQTVEAIKIIQQSKLPMIVAINKIDLPDANIEKVKQDLSAMNLLPEDWGGKTICVPISAKQNTGLDDLLTTVLLVSELQKDKLVANPEGKTLGTIIESHIDKGEGPVATVLIHNGALKVGDNIIINEVFYGRARALKDFNNKEIKAGTPSMPVKIIGLKFPPKVGDIAEVTEKIERRHKISPANIMQERPSILRKQEAKEEKESTKKFNIILRADVLGSLEVISDSIEKIEAQDVRAVIVSRGLGNINESDVELAANVGAVIYGFHVKADASTADLARDKKVEIKFFDVIYKLLDEAKSRLSEMITPEIVRKNLGKLQVLAIFRTEAKSMIVGVRVLEGRITKGVKAEDFRNGKSISSGEIAELKIGKEVVTDAVTGQECGILYIGKPELKIGDIMEAYSEESVKKKL